jgi:hypothetical protein
MIIKGPAVLLAACAVIAPSANAETAQQGSTPLPQFVSPAQRHEIAQRRQETGSVSPDARQAAEELSGKFSDTQIAAAEVDQPTGRETDSHVAVLVAPSSKKPQSEKTNLKPKTQPSQDSVSASTKRPVESKAQRKDIQSRAEARAGADSPIKVASDALPGTDAGWRTGIIGMLTNPMFWHSPAKPGE